MKDIDTLVPGEYETLLQPVWKFLASAETPIASDIIFVFGGIDLAVPRRAADLYRAGYARHVLVSGGAGALTHKHFDRPEAHVFSDEMERHGVPRQAIVIEDRATNTSDNVRLGVRRLAEERIPLKSALLVAKPFLIRRCAATFGRICPAVTIRMCPPEGGVLEYCDRSRADFAARLVAEVERLERYAEKGDIEAVDIPGHVRIAVGSIRKALES